jgi:hypothetical protein
MNEPLAIAVCVLAGIAACALVGDITIGRRDR